MSDQDQAIIEMTSAVVSAYVGKHSVRPSQLPELIQAVHSSFKALGAGSEAEEPAVELKPAVPIRRSITEDFIVCLDDGKKFKSLKRHLAQLGMTPNEYRAKWGLPRDYPMVAPGYAAKRSELARASGLGSSRRGLGLMEGTALDPVGDAPPTLTAAPEVIAEPDAPAPTPPKRRGRPPKAAA